MAQKAEYKTKQMAQLRSYMEQTQGRHITANDICALFKADGISVGTATVYRNLEKMVEQRLVVKYTVDGTSSACYEYVGEDKNKNESKTPCYHCKCEKCGKLIHIHCSEVEEFSRHLQSHHNFEMDSFRTVFYGICAECKSKQ